MVEESALGVAEVEGGLCERRGLGHGEIVGNGTFCFARGFCKRVIVKVVGFWVGDWLIFGGEDSTSNESSRLMTAYSMVRRCCHVSNFFHLIPHNRNSLEVKVLFCHTYTKVTQR